MEIIRQRRGKAFAYMLDGKPVSDKETLERIQSLSIPPAWDNVSISRYKGAKVQARGRDSADRPQAIYNPVFRNRQDAIKFAKTTSFALQLPKLRKQIEKDLLRRSMPKDKVLACVVKLIDEAYFRVGNERYAKENQSYGITTMRSKHVDVKGYTVTFDFMGKSGKHHHKVISDRQLAHIIRQLEEQPGYEIFRYQEDDGSYHDVTSMHINDYIKKYMGEEYSAKDFRTWGGTLLAIEELAATEKVRDKRERKKIITQCIMKVSHRLGNTPAIAKESYIDPLIFKKYLRGADFKKIKATIAAMRPRKYISAEERCALKILKSV